MKVLLPLCVIFLSLSLFAQEDKGDFAYDKESKSIIPKYLGKVILIKGNVTADGKEGKRALSMGAKLYPQDTISTESGSLVKIEMVDTTILTAGPSSSLNFENWSYRTKSDRDLTINLMKGKMRSHFKVKAKKDDALKIKVGHVAMGVRGTRIMANYYQRDDQVIVSHVATLSGKTNVYDKIADKEMAQKAGGQYISFLKPDGTVLKVKTEPLTEKELKYLRSDDKNPLKYFRPFMKEFKGKNIDQATSASGTDYQESTYSKNKRKKKGSWKDTLKKLNQRLDDSK